MNPNRILSCWLPDTNTRMLSPSWIPIQRAWMLGSWPKSGLANSSKANSARRVFMLKAVNELVGHVAPVGQQVVRTMGLVNFDLSQRQPRS